MSNIINLKHQKPCISCFLSFKKFGNGLSTNIKVVGLVTLFFDASSETCFVDSLLSSPKTVFLFGIFVFVMLQSCSLFVMLCCSCSVLILASHHDALTHHMSFLLDMHRIQKKQKYLYFKKASKTVNCLVFFFVFLLFLSTPPPAHFSFSFLLFTDSFLSFLIISNGNCEG